MSSGTPAISVVMPMRNSAAFVGDALRSIQSQAIAPMEVLVVDDGSTDMSRDIVATAMAGDPSIRLLEGPQRGPGPARNVALRQTKGEFVAFLDSDDLWPADKLDRQMARFSAEPRVDIVSGFVRYFVSRDDIGLVPDSQSVTEELFHVHLGSTIYRRAVFDRIGIFDESFIYSEDVDLMLRVREAAVPMAILDEIVLYYRRHPSSMTSVYTGREKTDFNRALLLSTMRRRKAGKVEPLTPFADLVEARGSR